MGKVSKFSVIGGSGFRAQYFFRIAAALPNLFQIVGTVVRDEEKGKKIAKQWNTPVYQTIDSLLANESPDFIVVSVNGEANVAILLELAKRGIPVLVETPPATNLDGLLNLHEQLTLKGQKVQVAEQYHLHPIQQARLALLEAGKLGKVTEASVSISHFYHGVSLLRKMLNIDFEEVEISGKRFMTSLVAGPTRAGYPKEEKIIEVPRDLVWLDFGGKLGIYDFTKDQHRSWIRSNHISIRGEYGEIFDDHVNYLANFKTPIHIELKRINKGEKENQEGHFLYGILAGEKWVYENPFLPARLYDDEIAIAHCLLKMSQYIKGGPSFYSLAEASQDHYLGLMMEEAIRTGKTIRVKKQPWANG